MGDFAGERIDFQNGQRRARQDLRQQLFAITARTQGVVNRQMFDIAITGKLPAAAQANKSPVIKPRFQRIVRVAQRLKFGVAFALFVPRKGAGVQRVKWGESVESTLSQVSITQSLVAKTKLPSRGGQ